MLEVVDAEIVEASIVEGPETTSVAMKKNPNPPPRFIPA
jgi:hypothetical protein